MAQFLAIEGIDGSGKGTQCGLVQAALTAQGHSAEVISFPQYSATRFGHLIGRFLNGEFGALEHVAPELVALLFAGDRCESKTRIEQTAEKNEFVIFDRYVSSNIAHQAGKLDGEQRQQLTKFIEWLEFDLNSLPKPNVTVWLDIPPTVAQKMIARKTARDYTLKAADLQEADFNHLDRTSSIYAELAGRHGWTHVRVVEGEEFRDASEITAEIVSSLSI